MSEFKYDKTKLLEATNGGLDIILHFYPEADRKGSGKFPHFKTKDATEDHASAIIFKTRDGNYVIKHFGGGDNLTPFDLVMVELGLEFYDACKWIAATFDIEGMDNTFSSAVIEMKPATKKQKHGDYFFNYRPLLSEFELKILGPLVSNKTASEFNLFSCDWFIQIKQYAKDHKKYPGKKMQIITKSADNYPIFVFENDVLDADGKPTGEKWQKIYQPLNKDKGYRFRYAGKKPENYLFGKDLIAEYYEPLKKGLNEFNKKEYEAEYGEGGDLDPRADFILIAGGDRDSINVASLEIPVVWKNSETEPLTYEHYKFLKARCKRLCYLGDLDPTGVQETIKLALQFLDIHIIHLPEWLGKLKYRGKPQKDMTDYCKAVFTEKEPYKVKTEFLKLVNDALPARFWDYKHNSSGKFSGYEINNEATYRFLQYNGYYRIKEENSKDPFSFVHTGGGILKRVDVDEIQNFPGQFVKERKKGNIPLLNYIHRSPQLSDKKLSKLDIVEPDLSGATGPEKQCFFFKNNIWEITPEGITAHKYGKYDVTVWDNKIIDRDAHLNKDQIFTIKKIDGAWDIEIHKKDNHFLNFLINTSRIHWRLLGDAPFKKEIAEIPATDPKYKAKVSAVWAKRDAYREENKFNIAESGLSDDLIAEQKLNLVNKIFAFGFALHRYKVDSKAWSGFAMDNRISDISDSNGGSGKSIMWHKALVQMLQNYKYINGGDPDSAKDKFLYDGVTPDTDAVIFDDLDARFPMKKVYNNVTGEFNVNAKFGKPYSLKYKDSPKVFFTSNFGIYGNDSSTMRRLLITVFSDYYHHNSDEDLEAWSVRNDIGFDLFSGFDAGQWNDFYAFAAQACQFQLQTNEKIDPPMENVIKRNTLQTIGDGFKDWADLYFEDRKNILVVREHAYNAVKAAGMKLTAQRFTKQLNGWCKLYGYVLDPPGALNGQGHCKHHLTQYGKTLSCAYIQTSPDKEINLNAAAPEDIKPGDRLPENAASAIVDEDKDDLPF